MAQRGMRRHRRQRYNPQAVRPVHVNPYTRQRRGRTEHVCEHWRSLPGTQLAFDF
ncbi:TPA: hypothetical protein L5668_005755 [Pseudomonas aeruginosa]|nr:hypothetical protein [Pseudomonas aeruginosa]